MAKKNITFTLITGASSGIGRETAIKLSASNNLILHGTDEERLKETLEKCHRDNHIIWQYDFRDLKDVKNSLKSLIDLKRAFISNFIHCAGMVSVLPARRLSFQSIQTIMDVNFTSSLEIISVLLSKKINKKELQNVLFVSSIWSMYGAKGYTLYSASKGALDSAMRSLAVELAPDIRVNSVVFGAINTPLAKASFSDREILENFNNSYPMGTGTVEEAAEVIAFLISEKARWITGQQIVADGGRSINMSPK